MKSFDQAFSKEVETVSNHPSNFYVCLHDLILGASAILQAKIIEDLENKVEQPKPASESFFNCWHLTSYVNSHPNDYPAIEKIYRFLYNLYHYHDFGVDCCVCMLIFLLRFLKESKIPLFKKNWKKVVITATLISQKIVCENQLSNYEFGLFFDGSVNDMLYEMENDYLNLFNYNYEIDEKTYEAVIDILKSVFDAAPNWKIDYVNLNKIVEKSKEMTREVKEIREEDQFLIRRVDAMILDDYTY